MLILHRGIMLGIFPILTNRLGREDFDSSICQDNLHARDTLAQHSQTPSKVSRNATIQHVSSYANCSSRTNGQRSICICTSVSANWRNKTPPPTVASLVSLLTDTDDMCFISKIIVALRTSSPSPSKNGHAETLDDEWPPQTTAIVASGLLNSDCDVSWVVLGKTADLPEGRFSFAILKISSLIPLTDRVRSTNQFSDVIFA